MPSSEVMHKWKTGKLRSGRSGKPVKSHEQAVAIMLSERRNEQAHGGEYVSGPERANPLEGTRRPRHHKEK
jgi:hypothetical protein